MQHNNLPADTALKLLTYNVRFDNSKENKERLVEFISKNDADVICLQEVTPLFYKELTGHQKIGKDYLSVYPDEFLTNSNRDGDLLLVRKKLNPTLYKHVRLNNSRQGRFFSSGFLTIKDITVVIGTAHLESIFFSPGCAAVKAEQLKQICHTLEAIQEMTNADCIIFAGDCNMTGTDGNQLAAENNAISAVNLVDVWTYFNDTTDNTKDATFRDRDATWNGEENAKQIRHREYHRPDRIFMRSNGKVEPESIEMHKSDMSDHYALSAQFKVV